MKIKKITQVEWLPEVTKYIRNGNSGILFGITDAPVVIVHRRTQVDADACEKMGYEVLESYNNGGTIVSNAGDVVIAHFYAPGNDWMIRFSTYFVNWLKNKGLNAVYEDNDVLIDGYKVCGTCITRYGKIDYNGVYIGIYTNLDHIKQICRKPMKKVPKGLSEYGITSEEVEQMFLDFCN
jgi:lipoate-protein ligase A